ncbi:MAG TPA: hypothetical protein PKC21_03670 [Oligoflexia bacterium]|nr:hypothetical protein [Oligoflexia bacterium]HMR24435.1 hypothetical protein [Oligoflexia bacterium]
MKKIYLILILLGLTFNYNTVVMADNHTQAACDCGSESAKACEGKACDTNKQDACAHCKAKYKKHHWAKKKMDHTQFYLSHAKELGLDKKQVKTLEDQQKSYEKKQDQLHKEWKELHDDFAQKIHDKKLTEAQIKEHAQKVGALKAQKVEHNLMHQHTSSKVLTEEQNKKVWEMLKSEAPEKSQKKSGKKKHKKHKKKK